MWIERGRSDCGLKTVNGEEENTGKEKDIGVDLLCNHLSLSASYKPLSPRLSTRPTASPIFFSFVGCVNFPHHVSMASCARSERV